MINSSKGNLISIMSSKFTISIVVISFICSEALQQDRQLISITGPLMTVSIINENDYHLGVHCKSANKDFGFRLLKKGEIYEWKFHNNLTKTTLYFCGFHDGQIDKGIFDIYIALRDEERCKICTWKAVKDGIYGYSDKHPEPALLFYKWLK
ncbi:Plant self-incompatibility S1 [Arabidopsis suecica]|uniref:S-protein homolog n=1 Tax=Arabidopsis suecica TaxID=45249 RepID=A0A8T2AGD1_ARASU|nr:Plant self-incompatibility S1 [Arabidopsis suecica]